MHLLALDQASRVSGWSVYYDNKLIAIGKFSVDDEDIGKRLLKIRMEVRRLLVDYDIDYVIFEDIQLQGNVANNVQTFKVLAEVYGVISELLTELQIPYSTVLATVWKPVVGIKGKSRDEQKRNAQKYITEKYNIKVTQDEADSACIGEYYINSKRSAWD